MKLCTAAEDLIEKSLLQSVNTSYQCKALVHTVALEAREKNTKEKTVFKQNKKTPIS